MRNVTKPRVQNQQMSLSDLLWATTAVALVIAYAQRWGQASLWLAAWYLMFVVATSFTLGVIERQLKNAFFWSGLGAWIAFLAVAGGRPPSPPVAIGWGTVGALCGGLCGLRIPKSAGWGTLISGLAGCLALVACLLALREQLAGLVLFDVACAAFVGTIFRPFCDFLQWFQLRSGQSRVVLAAWLSLCILLGNFLVPIVAGVER